MTWRSVALLFGGILLLGLIGFAAQGRPAPTGPAPAATAAPVAPSLVDALATATPPAPEPPTGPQSSFGGDGTYVVGADILPGTYRTTGPAESGYHCIWERLSDTTGDPGAVLASDGSQGPVTLTVKDSDAAVRTSGCTGWAKVD